MPLINSKKSGYKILIPTLLVWEKIEKLNLQHCSNVTTLSREEGLVSRDGNLDSRDKSVSSREGVRSFSFLRYDEFHV